MAKRTVNEDLRKERTTCTFNLEELTNYLDEGVENTEKRRKLGRNLYSNSYHTNIQYLLNVYEFNF